MVCCICATPGSLAGGQEVGQLPAGALPTASRRQAHTTIRVGRVARGWRCQRWVESGGAGATGQAARRQRGQPRVPMSLSSHVQAAPGAQHYRRCGRRLVARSAGSGSTAGPQRSNNAQLGAPLPPPQQQQPGQEQQQAAPPGAQAGDVCGTAAAAAPVPERGRPDAAQLPQPLAILQYHVEDPDAPDAVPETTYYILGTAHVSAQSCRDAAALIQAVRPQVGPLGSGPGRAAGGAPQGASRCNPASPAGCSAMLPLLLLPAASARFKPCLPPGKPGPTVCMDRLPSRAPLCFLGTVVYHSLYCWSCARSGCRCWRPILRPPS